MPSPSVFFAFGWTNLSMLGWLAAAAAPILIHLWSRRRYREMPFAAIEYLLAAVREQSRRLLIEQWLMLALRIAIIALVVLAFAEPYFERAGAAFTPGKHVHRMLVIDGSYSMAYKPADKTRFEAAKQIARQIVAESPEGDAFTLVLMSSTADKNVCPTVPRVLIGTPTRDRSAVLEEIDGLRLPHTTADLTAAVPRIRQLIETAAADNPRLDSHAVCFLTDLQRLTWAPKLSETAKADFLEQTQALAEVGLLVIDVGQPAAENLAVTDLEATDPLMTLGRNTSFLVRLRRFGGHTSGGQPVELFVDGRKVGRQEATISSDGTATVEFPYRFESAGDHAVEARAPGDALDVDNHRYLAAAVRPAIRVLCIDGRPSAGHFRGAAQYLAVALAPHGESEDDSPLRVEIAPENALLEGNLAAYDCIFLCDVAQFTANEARTLDAFLEGGGNLIFFLGDQVIADRYNRELGIAGQGRAGGLHILPARLDRLVTQPQTGLDPLGYRHPIVQSFRGRGETSLVTTPVFKHYRLVPPDKPEARSATVLALGDGNPLVVEHAVHRGRVVLIATSADPSWTAMPLWPSFVPLVHEIVAWCAAGQTRQRNLIVGEPLDARVAAAGDCQHGRVQTPDGRLQAAAVRNTGDGLALGYAETWQSGIYAAQFAAPLGCSQMFAVNVDTVESDLAPLDIEQLRSEVWPDVPFNYETSWQESGPVAPILASAATRNRLHIDLLYAAMALLLIETLLGWRLGSKQLVPVSSPLNPDP